MECQGRYGAHSLTSQIQFLKSKAQTELDEANGKLQALHTTLEEESAVHEMLGDLPEKITRPVMVPFGGAAFFPGHLVHTNEVMVNLGSSHIVECSAKHAQGIVGRRMKKLGGEIEGVEKQIQSLRSDIRNLENQAAEGIVDIVEEYDESRHGFITPELRGPSAEEKGAPGLATMPETTTDRQGSSGNVKSGKDDDDDAELFAMMDRMAKLEQDAEAQEAETTSTSMESLKEGNVGATSSEKGERKEGERKTVKKKPSGLKKGFLAGPKPHTATRKDPARGVPGGKMAETGFLLERKKYEVGKAAVEGTVKQPVATPVRGVRESEVIERNIHSASGDTTALKIAKSSTSEVEGATKKKPVSRFKEQMMKKRAAKE